MANRVRVAAVAELQDDGVQGFRVGDLRVAVARRDGGFVAFDDRCPHRGALLSRGNASAQAVSCPLHHWAFHLETGSCSEDSSLKLTFFDTFVAGGELFIELADEIAAPQDFDGRYRYLIRYGALGWVADFVSDAALEVAPRTRVILQTSRGVEHGELLVQPRAAHDPDYDSRQPAGRIVRLAQDADRERLGSLGQQAIPELQACQARISEQQLQLEVIDAEVLFDGETVVLYYLGGDNQDVDGLAADLNQNTERRVVMQSVFDPEPAAGGGCSGCSCGAAPSPQTAGSGEN